MKRTCSYEEIRERFATAASAAKCASAQTCTAMHRRERRCVAKALGAVPTGARVLDLPCGTGRMLPVLVAMGWKVTAADFSAYMVAAARQYAQAEGLPLGDDDFRLADIIDSGFQDDAFDAVVCNRLFHHFAQFDVRRRALRELRRICTGPIVVSFFRRLGYDAATHGLKHWLLRKPAADRIPIPLRTFKADIAAAGLVLKEALGTRPLISKQWYVVLERGPGGDAAARPPP